MSLKNKEYGLSLREAEGFKGVGHLTNLIELADAVLDQAVGGAPHDGEGCNLHGAHSPAPEPSPNFDFEPYEYMGGEGRGDMHQTQTQDKVNCSSTGGTADAPQCDVDTCTVQDTEWD
jgi:hypothetical protein